MIMETQKIIYCQAVKNKHPEASAVKCYEALANGAQAQQTEIHGFVVDDKYFVDSKTMQVYDLAEFILVENIEDSLSD